mgnify:CR=1 FL=1
MEKQSKKELLIVVERQADQLKRYEARLRDVVQAYKGLQKEKSALEKSLRVLGTSGKVALAEKDLDESVQDESGNTVKESASDGTEIPQAQHVKPEHIEDSSVPDGVGDDIASLQSQVKTLREALDTIMEQKTKMESSFQADKKKYLHELETKEEGFARERDEFSKQKEATLKDIQELRQRTRNEQQERETEQNDHALMLKEMQVLVAKERLAREELQNQIEDLKKSITEKKAHENKQGDESKGRAAGAKEGKSLDKSIQVSDTPSMLLKLEKEMKKIKLQLEKDILSEQQRANEAERRATLVAKAEEQRVADLEAKLSELSNVVGKYERLRSHDQMEIKKLKDRLYMLTTTPKDDFMEDNRNVENNLNLDNDNLDDVFRKLKEVLRFRFENREEIPESNDVGFSRADLECILKNDPAHKACREELRQLKDEFECYKEKAQIMRKSRLESETDSNSKDTEKLKTKIKDLKTTIETLHRDFEDKECELDSLQESLACEKMNLQKLHQSELENERTIYSAKMQELEKQMQNQRSRTMLLINEKDCEIERLKKKVVVDHSDSLSIHRKNASMLSRSPSSSDDAVNELLLQSTPSPLVHYAQEQAYCEAEFMLLKKQRRELEESMEEVRVREEQASEQVNLLKEEVRKLERNCSRENANLEYLKNVILRYLLTNSESVRQQMVAAISTILEFSPQEVEKNGCIS